MLHYLVYSGCLIFWKEGKKGERKGKGIKGGGSKWKNIRVREAKSTLHCWFLEFRLNL